MPPEVDTSASQKVIIIHPGSLFLRIGRASDLNPYRILHVIARRRKSSIAKFHRDSILPPTLIKTKEVLAEMEESRLQVSHTLQSCLQSDGRKRYATPPQQISAFNRRSQLVTLSNETPFAWLHTKADFIVGDDVLALDPKSDFNIHFPWRRGDLNIHNDIGGSLTAVLADLQQIWESVLQCIMGIGPFDLPNYKAVLVVPDIYQRTYLKELTNMLLKMGFGSCFLVQDHVAATFGAGLGSACVVDCGDQKVSVSCVEDGISHPSTRVRLEYGGADVTQCYFWLLKKCAFPFKECNDSVPRDAMLLHNLKEQNCHVDLDICGSIERHFKVYHPNQAPSQYTIMVGDEAIVAPLSLFYPDLLGITGRKKAQVKVQKPGAAQPDAEDCFDAEYLRETSRRGAREQMDQSTDVSGINTTENNDEDMVDQLEVEKENKSKEFILPGGHMIGIDQAILQSIERCPNEEMKRKMYGCILVVGGGMKFRGIGKWLQSKVSLQTPYIYRTEQLDVLTNAKDLDPSMTTWKGAAIMSCLESAPELWITKTDWEKHGLKVLREKAPFMW